MKKSLNPRRLPSRESQNRILSPGPSSNIDSATINIPDRLLTIQPEQKVLKMKAKTTLAPVAPPKRDGSMSPDGDAQSVSGSQFGYQSNGGSSVLSHGIPTDSESSRFSTIHHYKYNGGGSPSPHQYKNVNIQKVSPNAPLSRGHGAPRPNIHRSEFNASQQPSEQNMPLIIKKADEYSAQKQTISTQGRKASPEAMSIMLSNLKANQK